MELRNCSHIQASSQQLGRLAHTMPYVSKAPAFCLFFRTEGNIFAASLPLLSPMTYLLCCFHTHVGYARSLKGKKKGSPMQRENMMR